MVNIKFLFKQINKYDELIHLYYNNNSYKILLWQLLLLFIGKSYTFNIIIVYNRIYYVIVYLNIIYYYKRLIINCEVSQLLKINDVKLKNNSYCSIIIILLSEIYFNSYT